MNVTLNANAGWGTRDIELEAGVIDETAKHVFTHGHCHSLALAIHEATGWDVIGDDDRWDDIPGHVAVEVPGGLVLDITGLHAPDAWAAEWGDIRLVDPVEAYNAFDGRYREPDIPAANHWVMPVLHEYVPKKLWPRELVTQ